MQLNKRILTYIKLARLDKPTAIFLVMIPPLWSAIISTTNIQITSILVLKIIIGSILMRSAGCIINDLADRDFDSKVERTKNRPIANGEISILQAIIFLSVLLALSLALLLTMNRLAIKIGLFTIVPVIIYPFMKRVTYFPQVFLGFTYNLGVLIAYAEQKNTLDLTAFSLYLAAFFWTMIYDTIYAHMDKEYDELIGIKSTALKFKGKTKTWLNRFNLMAIICLVVAGTTQNYYFDYFLILAVSLFVNKKQISSLHINSPEDCMKKFKNQVIFGTIILIAIIAERIV